MDYEMLDTELELETDEFDNTEELDESDEFDNTDDTDESEEFDLDTDTEDWKQVTEDLERLGNLQSHILQRMESLSVKVLDTESIYHSIEECHQASLEDQDTTGEITFGYRLLRLLDTKER